MKLKMTLSQTDMLPPVRGDHSLSKYKLDDQTYSVVFNLTKDCSTTEKFIRIMDTMLKEDILNCSYNFYPSVQVDTFFKMKKRMNWIIEQIKSKDGIPNVDESLVLNENSLDCEILKLNALHLYFENVSNMPEVKDSAEYCQNEEIYQLLEEINQLVHSMEYWSPPENLEFFGTTRLMTQHGEAEIQNLTDEDYNNFRTDFEWGDLTLDYFRVGKDLQTCYATNDIELVKTKGLEQQITVHPAFEVRLREETTDGFPHWTSNIDAWIKENNLDQYYDFNLPMFTSGRIILGKIDMTETNKEEVIKEMVKCTKLTNVELIDE